MARKQKATKAAPVEDTGIGQNSPVVESQEVKDVAPQETPKTSEVAPAINPATEHNSRKPFQLPQRLAIQFDGKEGLVVSGYSKTPIDGHYPHVSVWRILRDLNLNPRKYAQCDERHQEVVAAAQAAGLKVITVDEYQERLIDLASIGVR